MNAVLYGPVFQTAYIVADMSAAIDTLSRRFGIAQFLRTPGAVTLTPGDAEPMQVELGLAFVGATMIELIRPAGGADAVYRSHVPLSAGALRFHHLAFRLWNERQWTDMLVDARDQGYRVVMSGEQNNTRFLYLDTREELGHYTEYLFYIDPPRTSLPRIPQNLAMLPD